MECGWPAMVGQPASQPVGRPAGQVGWPAGHWPAGRAVWPASQQLAGWLAGRPAGWLAGWRAGPLAGWLAGRAYLSLLCAWYFVLFHVISCYFMLFHVISCYFVLFHCFVTNAVASRFQEELMVRIEPQKRDLKF